MKLAGILYLHEISQARMVGTALKNLDMFKKLCGDDALVNVVLGTTKWSDIRPEVGQKREKQLVGSFWKDMIQHGSIMMQVHTDSSSAWTIIHHLLGNTPIDFVLIQAELVEHQKTLEQTTAGQMLRYTLEELLKQQKNMARQMKGENGATRVDAEFRQRLSENRQSIHSTLAQIGQLREPLGPKTLGAKVKRYFRL